MAAEMDNVTSNQQKDEEIEKMEKRLENWKVFLLKADKILTWEKPFYPYVLAGTVTLVFIVICWLQPSILTSVAMALMIACLVDYLAPTLRNKYADNKDWTADQEAQFQHICIALVDAKRYIQGVVNSVKKLKSEKPKHHFILVMSVLGFVAFIGNLIPNLLLAYLIVLALVLLPGLKHRGILTKYYALIMEKIGKLIKRKKKAE
ncbi:ADP-ribosylation factor-like protein 6-interacting protein 1 [Ptychodera flava]|uniref:ADP-ribosylation factor-like protein 6-interacting protein 1 n=1 Tax=Ptychodera flava TaxID=63121 RepID=UPI00396A29D2